MTDPAFPTHWADPGDARLFWQHDHLHWSDPLMPLEEWMYRTCFAGLSAAARANDMPVHWRCQLFNRWAYEAVLPLGAQPDGDYRDVEANLLPGDVVVFSSDGLVEAPALPTATATAPAHLPTPEQPGELFGFSRLASSAAHWSSHAHTADSVTAGIWSDLTDWCGDESHHDDMTLLILCVSQ